MLISREYRPKRTEIVYHYCDANAFHAICTSKTIRLSDLFSMNDFLEVHWGYSIWEKAANEVLKYVGEDFLKKVDAIISTSGIKGNLLASCFSMRSDVLSQWRAYANDGNGYCIGFRATEIMKLPVRPLKILYDEKKQLKETVAILKAIHEVENEERNNEKYGADFFSTCTSLAFDLAAFKNPAFSEEKEIRFVHILNFELSNKFLKLVDGGGKYFGKPMEGREVKFRIVKNLPVPYIDVDFTNGGNVNPTLRASPLLAQASACARIEKHPHSWRKHPHFWRKHPELKRSLPNREWLFLFFIYFLFNVPAFSNAASSLPASTKTQS